MESKFVLDSGGDMGWGLLHDSVLELQADSAEARESQSEFKWMCGVWRETTLKIDLVTDVFRKKIREKWM